MRHASGVIFFQTHPKKLYRVIRITLFKLILTPIRTHSLTCISTPKGMNIPLQPLLAVNLSPSTCRTTLTPPPGGQPHLYPHPLVVGQGWRVERGIKGGMRGDRRRVEGRTWGTHHLLKVGTYRNIFCRVTRQPVIFINFPTPRYALILSSRHIDAVTRSRDCPALLSAGTYQLWSILYSLILLDPLKLCLIMLCYNLPGCTWGPGVLPNFWE